MASVERPARPASVVFLAVCQLIVGSIGLVWGVYQAGSAFLVMNSPAIAKAAQAGSDPVFAIEVQAPFFPEASLAASLVGLVLSLVLIADGVGLLLMRRWAYNLGVLYGWLSIVYQVAWLAYTILVVLPMLMAGMDNMVVPALAAANPQAYRESAKAMAIVRVAGSALGLLYPIFVLIMLAVTRKAFRRPRPAAEAAEGYEPDAAEGRYAGEPEPSPGYRGKPDDRIGPAPH